MVLEEPWALKRIFLAFKKGLFQFFANCWVTKVEPFLGKRDNATKTFSITSILFLSLYLITLDKRYWNFWIFQMFPFEYSTGASLIGPGNLQRPLIVVVWNIFVCDIIKTFGVRGLNEWVGQEFLL